VLGDTPTGLEQFLGLPMVSNVLGRWVPPTVRIPLSELTRLTSF